MSRSQTGRDDEGLGMDLKKTDIGVRAFGKDSKVAVTVKYESQQRALGFIRDLL